MRLQGAIQAMKSGKFISMRKVAKDYNVSYSTLWNRTHGISDRRSAHEHMQLLDNVKERVCFGTRETIGVRDEHLITKQF